VKRVLVTGAAGFVGANLVRRLLADGHEVDVLLRSTTDRWRLLGIERELRIHDVQLMDGSAVLGAVDEARPDWVFHLASHGAYPWQQDATAILATNVIGTLNILEAAADRGVEAFVHAGSSSEYGFKDHPPRETEILAPNSYYAVGKAAATLLCSHKGAAHRLPTATLRLYSVYGPWEEPGRLIPALVCASLNGRLPPLVDPLVARDFVFVDDAVEAFVLAAEHAIPGVYNIGSGRQTSLEALVEVARRVFAVDAEPQWGSMEKRSWDATIWVADPRRAQAELGWAPSRPIDQGLLLTADWLQSTPGVCERYTESRSVSR
jgi:dolichol-phosphate mannosyltransferase